MTMQDAFDLWQKKAQGSSCNYGFHMAISEWNAERAAEIERMRAQGVTSFKMYMVYDAMRLNDGEIYSALKHMAALGCISGVHCENYDLLNERIRELRNAGVCSPLGHPMSRPNEVESEAVPASCDCRARLHANLGGAPFHARGIGRSETGQSAGAGGLPRNLSAVSGAGRFALRRRGRGKVHHVPAASSAGGSGSAVSRDGGRGNRRNRHRPPCYVYHGAKALGGGEFYKTPNAVRVFRTARR
jgi:hypothetical protein